MTAEAGSREPAGGPYVSIDLAKVEHNAHTIARLCASRGIAVAGVTKGACGLPRVARAMLRGGVSGLGESRLANVRRLAEGGVRARVMLLRPPALAEADAAVAHTDISLNSELAVIEALHAAARRRGRVHEVVVMVDLGDLREGVWPEDLVAFVRRVLELRGVRLAGIGTNLSCYGGVVPTAENMGRLVECALEIERTFGIELDLVSGGNSSSLPLIAAGAMPPRVNHVRIGEAILLGRETIRRTPWPHTHQDAFVLHAEVIERKRKPSVPLGERGEDAFGRRPEFVDRGERERAIVALGRADVAVEGIAPTDPRLVVLGASSDALIVDVTDAEPRVEVGDRIAFGVDYGGLLTAMASPYVDKRCIARGDVDG